MTTKPTTHIEFIVEQVRVATDYQLNKRILREHILTELHLPYNNGMFKVTPDLLAFLATWPDDTLYLEDIYQNPIEVKREELLDLARQHYQSVLNTWHQQHEELKKIRKV